MGKGQEARKTNCLKKEKYYCGVDPFPVQRRLAVEGLCRGAQKLLEVNRSEFESGSTHLPATDWANHLHFLNFGFLICKMGLNLTGLEQRIKERI